MNPNRNLFKEFPNKVFVETGSYRGDGIQLALDAGFERIISIDIDPANIDFCFSRFDLANFPDKPIHLIHGDSAECLFDAIADINVPITFWLDSHWQMFEGTDPGKNPFPLIRELGHIEAHQINTHTIVIDDMLIMQNDIAGYSKMQIEANLKHINKKYQLEYFANPVINGILVAHL